MFKPSFVRSQNQYVTLLSESSSEFISHLTNCCPHLCLSLYIVLFAFEKEPARFET